MPDHLPRRGRQRGPRRPGARAASRSPDRPAPGREARPSRIRSTSRAAISEPAKRDSPATKGSRRAPARAARRRRCGPGTRRPPHSCDHRPRDVAGVAAISGRSRAPKRWRPRCGCRAGGRAAHRGAGPSGALDEAAPSCSRDLRVGAAHDAGGAPTGRDASAITSIGGIDLPAPRRRGWSARSRRPRRTTILGPERSARSNACAAAELQQHVVGASTTGVDRPAPPQRSRRRLSQSGDSVTVMPRTIPAPRSASRGAARRPRPAATAAAGSRVLGQLHGQRPQGGAGRDRDLRASPRWFIASGRWW